MSSPDAKIAALKTEIMEMSERLAHVAHQLERSVEQQPSHVHHSISTPASSNAAARIPPLDRDDVLDAVFNYVGSGDYFFAATVCSSWRRRYLKLCYSAAAIRSKPMIVQRQRKPKYTTAAAAAAAAREPKCTTFYSSVLMTTARLQLALSDSLEVAALQVQLDNNERLTKHITHLSLCGVVIYAMLQRSLVNCSCHGGCERAAAHGTSSM
jgi:hypothetical protein